jgi:DNA-binding CsgD family transcriptional regulator
LEEAAEIGVSLLARPLLREIRQLAGRAMIRLPESVDELLDAPDRQSLAGMAAVGGVGDGGENAERDGAMVAVGPGADDQTALSGAGTTTTGNGHSGGSALARGVIGEVAVAKQDTFGLSPREREVLALIAEGRTNREIGERLFISQKTVGVHVGNILAKLGVSGRVEAAAVAIRLGLTEPLAAGTPSGR